MNCPIARAGQLARKQYDTDELSDCLKEECAQWDKDGSQCSRLTVMKVLVNIEACLELIVKKMPTENQFRK